MLALLELCKLIHKLQNNKSNNSMNFEKCAFACTHNTMNFNIYDCIIDITYMVISMITSMIASSSIKWPLTRQNVLVYVTKTTLS